MNKRLQGLDLYRIIGCAFVIINHCNSKVLLQVTPGSLAWYVCVAVVFLSKITVPGFFMITGYNLLHRREEWNVYVKRILRIVVVLVVFSLFYYIWRNGRNSTVTGFLRVLWHDGATDAYWYLYTYLGLMIMMPLLQWVASAFDDTVKAVKLIKIIAVAAIYVSLIPSIIILVPSFTMNEYFDLPMIGCAVMYLFIGHACFLLRHDIRAGEGVKISDLRLTAVFLAAFIVNMLLAVLEFRLTGGETATSFSEIHTVGMIVESVAAFLFLIKIRAEGITGRIISIVAPATFGIYLLADFACTNTHMIYYNLCIYMNRLFAVAVQDVAAYAITLAAVLLIRLIPPVRKWL